MADEPGRGDVRDKKMIYGEGAEITLPAGHVYKLVAGIWVHQPAKCAVAHGASA